MTSFWQQTDALALLWFESIFCIQFFKTTDKRTPFFDHVIIRRKISQTYETYETYDLCFIKVLICDLFISRGDPLMS